MPPTLLKEDVAPVPPRFQPPGVAAHWRWVVVVIVLAAALAPSAWLAWDWRALPHLGVCHDDGVYWITAKSVADGRGYRMESVPGAPYQTKYPPLYSLLLASAWMAGGDSRAAAGWAMLGQWLLLPLYLLLTDRLFLSFGFGRLARLALAALLALNVFVVFFSTTLMSEIPFSLLLVAAVLATERAAKPGATAAWALAAGALAGLAYLTRTAALPLLVICPAYLVFRGRKTAAGLLFAAALPATAGWQWWQRAHLPGEADPLTLFYTNYLGHHYGGFSLNDMLGIAAGNLAAMLDGIGSLVLFSPESTFLGTALVRVLTVGALAGAVRLGRRTGKYLFHGFAAMYLVMLLAWTTTPDPRFLIPLLPLVLAGLATELGRMAQALSAALRSRAWGNRVAAAAAAGCLLLLAVHGARLNHWGLTRMIPSMYHATSDQLQQSQSAYDWIRRNLPPDARLITFAHSALYLHTGRQATEIHVPSVLLYRDDPGAIREWISVLDEAAARGGFDYLVWLPSQQAGRDHLARATAVERLADPARGTRVAFQDGDVRIYQLGHSRPPEQARARPDR